MKTDNKIWIYGKHAAIAALSNKNRKAYKLLVTKETSKQLAAILKKSNHLYITTTNKELDNLLGSVSHQGIALKTNSVFNHDLYQISHIFEKQKSLIIILDQLTDPQNIGNIIRSSYAFNADAIITCKNKSFSETPALIKSSCGAIEHIPITFVINLVSTIKFLKDKGYWIIGLDSNAKEYIHEFDFTPKTALIVGSEGFGLRGLTQKNCDFLLKIAMNSLAGSINASKASAIAMYSYFRCH